MIKIAAVVCLAALASAEADADFINAHAAPLRYSSTYAVPAASAAISVRGYVYGTPANVGSHPSRLNPLGYVADSVGAVHIAKREVAFEPMLHEDGTYGTYSNVGYSSYAAPAA